jgi:membrane protein implicated in regulation of membrane protease activity
MRSFLTHLGALALTALELLVLLVPTIWSILKTISEEKATGFGFVAGGISPARAVTLAAFFIASLYVGNVWVIRRLSRRSEPRTPLAFHDSQR